MDVDRRDFLKTAGLAGFGLFLPKWIKPSWKQKLITVRPDWELALLDYYGREVSGNGYARVSGSWDDFRTHYAWGMPNNREFTFPEATRDWGTIHSAKLFDRTGKFVDVGPVAISYPEFVRARDIVQFTPGNFIITMT